MQTGDYRLALGLLQRGGNQCYLSVIYSIAKSVYWVQKQYFVSLFLLFKENTVVTSTVRRRVPDQCERRRCSNPRVDGRMFAFEPGDD